jgi:DNA topoisomerase VI subunit B
MPYIPAFEQVASAAAAIPVGYSPPREHRLPKPAAAREVFRTNRAVDFANERELTAQIGHSRELWPAVVTKELIDNAIDAAEEAGRAPVLAVRVARDLIEVADNGPGLPDDVIDDVLDFTKTP